MIKETAPIIARSKCFILPILDAAAADVFKMLPWVPFIPHASVEKVRNHGLPVRSLWWAGTRTSRLNFLDLATASGFVRHFTPQFHFRIITADPDDDIFADLHHRRRRGIHHHRRSSLQGTAKRGLQAAADPAGGVHPAIPVAIVKRQSQQPTATASNGCGNWVYRMKNQPVPPPLILDGQPVLLPWKMYILSVSHTA